MTPSPHVSNEMVERAAIKIYDWLPYDGLGQKPAWVTGGNSLKQDEARCYARAALSAMPGTQVPEGWKLVPVDPSVDQVEAGRKSMEPEKFVSHARTMSVYEAMLNTAPAPPTTAQEG